MCNIEAEISLISGEVLAHLNQETLQMDSVRKCEIIGFSGHRTVVDKNVRLPFQIGSFEMTDSHQFAVVDPINIPYCLLLGQDYMYKYCLSLDFNQGKLLQNNSVVCDLKICDRENISELMSVRSVESPSHLLKLRHEENEFRFEMKGPPNAVTGLSLIGEDETVKMVQSNI